METNSPQNVDVTEDLSGASPSESQNLTTTSILDPLEAKFRQHELENNAQKHRQQNVLFYSILGGSAIMIVWVMLEAFKQLANEITPQATIILGILITAPIISILALMRYVYDGKKKDDPQPTLLLNVGKELATVIKSIFGK